MPRLGENQRAESLEPGHTARYGRLPSPAAQLRVGGVAREGYRAGAGRAGGPGGGRRRRGPAGGLRGRLGLAARAALRRWTGLPGHTEGTGSWLLPRGAASLARWLRVRAGRRARPVARPESVESSLRVAANPTAPFARPALPLHLFLKTLLWVLITQTMITALDYCSTLSCFLKIYVFKVS